MDRAQQAVEPVQQVLQSDTVAGAINANVGTIMLALQIATGFGNFFLVVLNLATVALGLFLMWPRIKKRWKELQTGEEADD